MSTYRILGLGFVGLLAVACSTTADAGDGDSPVAESALTGSIGGTSFKAVSATAHKGFGDDDGERRIEVYDTEVTCDAFGGGGGEGRSIIITTKWEDGFEAALSLKQNVTFYTPPGENNVATQGRLEVVKAGASGEEGTVRLRAFIDDDNQVEGQVTVQVCDDES